MILEDIINSKVRTNLISNYQTLNNKINHLMLSAAILLSIALPDGLKFYSQALRNKIRRKKKSFKNCD
jgi:hypothetical protein